MPARSTSTRWTKAKAIACVKPMGSTTPDWWRSKPNSTLPIFSAAITISLPGSVFDVRRLLRARRERPRDGAAEQGDELAASIKKLIAHETAVAGLSSTEKAGNFGIGLPVDLGNGGIERVDLLQ